MSDITGAGTPIKLGDVTYLVSPLSDKDLIELDEFVRFVHVNAAVDSAPASMKDRALEIAIQQASALSFMSPGGAAIIKNHNGISRILWHGIRHNHPEVTHEQIRELIIKHEVVAEANRVFKKLNVDPLQRLTAGKKAQPVVSRRPAKKSTSRSSKGTTSRQKR
jgi:hypothetical protein